MNNETLQFIVHFTAIQIVNIITLAKVYLYSILLILYIPMVNRTFIKTFVTNKSVDKEEKAERDDPLNLPPCG